MKFKCTFDFVCEFEWRLDDKRNPKCWYLWDLGADDDCAVCIKELEDGSWSVGYAEGYGLWREVGSCQDEPEAKELALREALRAQTDKTEYRADHNQWLITKIE